MWVQIDCHVHSTDRLILDLIYFEYRWKIHWCRQISTLYTEFLRRIKWSYVRPSPVFQVPIHRNSTCWHTHSVKCSILNNNNFSIIIIHTILFFLKCLRPERVGKANWPGILWIQTLPYWGVTKRTSFLESGQFYAPGSKSLPGTTKDKLASLLHATHW